MEMATMTRVECTECFGRFFLENPEFGGAIPEGVKEGKTFPVKCPLCEEGQSAILLKQE